MTSKNQWDDVSGVTCGNTTRDVMSLGITSQVNYVVAMMFCHFIDIVME